MFLMLLLHYHKVLSRMTVTVRDHMKRCFCAKDTDYNFLHILFLFRLVNTEESRAVKEKAEQLIGS